MRQKKKKLFLGIQSIVIRLNSTHLIVMCSRHCNMSIEVHICIRTCVTNVIISLCMYTEYLQHIKAQACIKACIWTCILRFTSWWWMYVCGRNGEEKCKSRNSGHVFSERRGNVERAWLIFPEPLMISDSQTQGCWLVTHWRPVQAKKTIW